MSKQNELKLTSLRIVHEQYARFKKMCVARKTTAAAEFRRFIAGQLKRADKAK